MTAHAVLLSIPGCEDLPPPQRVLLQRDYARRALRRCAELCAAPTDGWAQDERGAPLPNQGYFWSLSHKRAMAAAVIARQPVGIDVEFVAPRREDLFDAVATEAEWALLADRSWHSFFRLFTAKEATLKANGMGIGYLAHCRIVEVLNNREMMTEYDSRRLPVEHFEHAGHIAAATVGAQPLAWHTYD